MKINIIRISIAIILAITFTAKAQTWSPVANGTNGDVYALGVYNNSLYIGGNFTELMGLTDTITSPMFAKFDGTNFDNTPLHFWDGGGITNFYNYNNDFFIAGDFSCPNNVSNVLVYKDHQLETSLYTLNANVDALVDFNGTLYAGGGFHSTDSSSVNYIAQWNSSTNKWVAVGSDLTNGEVRALAVFNGSLYAAGDFTVIGGVIANYIARWDGTNWNPVGLGLIGSVYALKVYNNMLYAGGQFVLQGTDSVNHIAALDMSNNWHTVGTNGIGSSDALADVRCFEVYGSELYIGGYFSIANGDVGNSIVRWNGTNFDPIGNGITSTGGVVYSLLNWNGNLYVGGSFSQVDRSFSANNICVYDSVFVGINEVNNEIITEVYPNPSSSIVNFNIHFKHGNNEMGTIKITDLMGNNIIEQTFYTGLNSIEVSSLAKGMYLYKVSNGNSSVQGKFIIN
jgi:hypothetical protein